MIMKKIFNIYKNQVVMVAVMLATLMTSCTDYLTIIPPDKIVHEHFWQTKDEVNGMMATSYLKLVSGDAVSKAIIWGELRADNMKYPANYNKEIKYIVEANLLDDNSYSRWGIYYEAINYANLVIEYAPLVVDRDPDFTEGDLEVVLGEMYAMRALCHFYLVRTFRDIPMALKPAVNDAELPDYNQVHPLQALDYIMADLDRAENMVMKTGNFTTPESNYGRITKNAVLAMKADFWLNLGQMNSVEEVCAVAPRFAKVDAVRFSRLYNNTKRTNESRGSDFWESGAVRPDLILQDLVKILHHEAKTEELYYYKKLGERR